MLYIYMLQLAMHSLVAMCRPRLSETEPKWFMLETSWKLQLYMHSKQNMNLHQKNT